MKKILSIIMMFVLVLAVGCQSTKTTDTTKKIETGSENNVTAEEADSSIALKTAINDGYQLIDARVSNAFNGWKLNDEMAGGHVEGAKLFSATWMKNMSDDEAKEYLKLQGLTNDQTLAVYGYGSDKMEVVEYLNKLGFKAVIVKEDFNTISSDELATLVAMPNYEVLVPASYVKAIIDGNIPSELAGKTIKIFEASWGPGDEYAKGHIPTAVHINTDEVEEGPLWNRVSDEQLMEMLKANGVTKDTVVIIYGADTTPAARVGLVMKYMGVEDVRLLDGGYQAWKAAGYEVAEGMVEKSPVEDTGLTKAENKSLIIDLEEAKNVLNDEAGDLISIRSWEEYMGETSGYDYIEAAGRIDGAKYGYAGLNPWNMADYRTPDNTMVDYEFLLNRWNEMGITKDHTNSFYCGTGWRAAEVWFYAYALGWDNISLYDGGWKEWSEANEASTTGMPEMGVPAGK